MRVLFVAVSNMRFAVAAHHVSEIIKVQEGGIISVVDRRAIRIREEIIPAARLDLLLGLSVKGAASKKDASVIVVQMGGEKLGLIVDGLLDEENVVIKSLPAHMKGARLVSGVTISADNEIVNLLHTPALFEAAKRTSETKFAERTLKEDAGAINILIVDDSASTRDIEKNILEAYGYRVSIAGDGMDALDMAKDFRYDVVITDVEMPRLDGFSLTERLRGRDAYRDTPIIIVTSREKEEDKLRGIAVGANAYIVKGSFDQTSLLETIHNLVG